MYEGSFVHLKDNHWLERQKHAGQCVAKILNFCKTIIETNKQPNINLLDIERQALSIMEEMNCTPTFKGYKGFPSSICISVNHQLVHGIVTDYTLKDGDLITVDLGTTYEGAIADAAYTYIYGQPKSKDIERMLDVCKKSLYAGIDAVKIGNRIGAIGNAIYKTVKDSGFGLITNYGGHGINYNKPHAEPFIANKANSNEGIRIQHGLSIAIEPMLCIGDTKTKILDDNWTIITNGLNCHFEHSVTVMEDKKYIITELSQ